MGIIYTIHSMFGERILPILIVAAAIYLSVTWKPDAPKSPIARFFPILVDIQVTLGMLWFVFLLLQGDGARLLSFPLLLHPITGFVAAGVAHMAVAPKGPFARLGRWSALAGLIVLLVLVLINIVVARSV